MLNFPIPEIPYDALCALVMREGLVLTLMSCLPYIEKRENRASSNGETKLIILKMAKLINSRCVAFCTNILYYFY